MHWIIPLLIDLGRLAWKQTSDSAIPLLSEGLTLAQELNQYYLARGLEAMVRVACARGKFEDALRFGGAAATLRDVLGTPAWPTEHTTLDSDLTDARQHLSQAVADYAWRQGSTESINQTVALALGVLQWSAPSSV
jgi:hypothetical protein